MNATVWLAELSPKKQGLVLVIILGSLITLQQTTTLGAENRLGIALNNAAHAPWFFLLTCLTWQFTGLFDPIKRRLRLLWLLVFAVVLSIALEALQLLSHRNADPADIALNLLGAGSAIATLVAIDSHRQGKKGKSWAWLLLAAIMMLTSFTRVAELLWVNYQRNSLAPALISFDPNYPLDFMIRGNWELIPTGNSPSAPQIAKVILSSQEQWPGLTFREPFPDWNNYQALNINAHADAPQTMQLEVRLETFSDRGMTSTVLIDLPRSPGRIRIPLIELAGARFGNLDNVKNLYLFKSQPKADESFFLTSIYLD